MILKSMELKQECLNSVWKAEVISMYKPSDTPSRKRIKVFENIFLCGIR